MPKVRFSGKLWPVRIKPKEDELLSSWMMRLAQAYGMNAQSFWSAAWPQQYLWSRDIDICDDQSFMQMLADKTQRPVSTFTAASLARYQGVLYDKQISRRRLPWVMPTGVYANVRRQYGLQYCPQCLAEDEEPYYRRIWRLAIAFVCLKHRALLADRCRQCGAAVCLHVERAGDSQHPINQMMARCYACGNDMRQCPHDSSACQVRQRDVDLQSLLVRVVNEGHYRMGAGYTVPSFIFFKVIRRLMLMLLRCNRAKSFRRVAKEYFGVEPLTTDHLAKGKTLETFDAVNRLRLLGMTYYLLQDWPSKYDDFCREDHLWSPRLFPNRMRVVDELKISCVILDRAQQ